jgi:hypothetical protein
MNECANCFFGVMTTRSPHLRPRLTCRAALPSSSEEYVWPVVPDEGWCTYYKRTYPAQVSTETEVLDMLEAEVVSTPVKPKGKK